MIVVGTDVNFKQIDTELLSSPHVFRQIVAMCDELHTGQSANLASHILDLSEHHSFSGQLLISGEALQGFACGRLYSTDEMIKLWGETYGLLLNRNPDSFFCFYIESIVVIPSLQDADVLKRLAKETLLSPFVRYPSSTGALTTNNAAVNAVATILGYQLLDEELSSQGNDRMGIARIRDIRIFA